MNSTRSTGTGFTLGQMVDNMKGSGNSENSMD